MILLISVPRTIVLLVALSLAATLQPSSSEALFLPLPNKIQPTIMKRFSGNTRVSSKNNQSTMMIRGGSDNNNYNDEEQGTTEAWGAQQPTPPPPSEDAVPPSSTTSPLVQGPKSTPPGPVRRSFPHFPYHRLPDYLTYLRCLAIPALCALFYAPGKHIACGSLFAFASFTDYLDGYLARRWDVSTAFGAFLDPVADKLMVSTALILLAGRHGAIVALPTCVILARELAVSALREWMAQRGERDSVQVGMQGKVKTALTMVSLTLMLLVPDVAVVGGTAVKGFLADLFVPSLGALYVCALITVTSGSVYFRAAAPLLMQKK